MCRDSNGFFLGDDTSHFFLPVLRYEATEAAEVHIIPFSEGIFEHSKESFQRSGNICFIDPGLLRDLDNYFSLSHVRSNLLVIKRLRPSEWLKLPANLTE